MNKTVREWIEFLNTEENQRFGLQMEDGISCHRKYYYPAEIFMQERAGWLDEIVTEVLFKNFEQDGIYYHLLIFKNQRDSSLFFLQKKIRRWTSKVIC